MREHVYSTDSYSTLLALATAMGWGSNGVIRTTGSMSGGTGNYFLNHVGTIYQPTGATTKDAMGNNVPVMDAMPGEWGRLRLNGPDDVSNAFLTALGAALAAYQKQTSSASLTIYSRSKALGGWTSDGVTLAPAWVDAVGVIA